MRIVQDVPGIFTNSTQHLYLVLTVTQNPWGTEHAENSTITRTSTTKRGCESANVNNKQFVGRGNLAEDTRKKTINL